jgi:PilZ domain
MQETQPQDPPRTNGAQLEKLVHTVLPVRLIHMQNGERSGPEMACTYDIHPRGARLLSARNVKVGDYVTVERGRLRSVCQVIWTADPDSALRGQFTVQCVEAGKTPWEEELRQTEEQYLPIFGEKPNQRPTMMALRGTRNRRRGPRFPIQGAADLAEIGGLSRECKLEQISEGGCLVRAEEMLAPGTSLRLTLSMWDVSVALRGDVRYTAEDRSMGVEFREIRQGDRPLLEYVLDQLKKKPAHEFAELEKAFEFVP